MKATSKNSVQSHAQSRAAQAKLLRGLRKLARRSDETGRWAKDLLRKEREYAKAYLR